jgi:dipeptidyl aminopeptidase/acylaminoacyl peptidase
VYKERSLVLIFHTNRIHSPLLVFQGSADQLVPSPQVEPIIDVVRSCGGKIEYRLHKGKGYNWCRAHTIVIAIVRMISTYGAKRPRQ